jgi:hypothetical protein
MRRRRFIRWTTSRGPRCSAARSSSRPAVEDARAPPRDPPPRIDDRCLLIADHPRFLELDVDRRQVFCDIADILVLGRPSAVVMIDHQQGDAPKDGRCNTAKTPWLSAQRGAGARPMTPRRILSSNLLFSIGAGYPSSPPAEKATTRQHQAGKSRTSDGTGNNKIYSAKQSVRLAVDTIGEEEGVGAPVAAPGPEAEGPKAAWCVEGANINRDRSQKRSG